MMASLSACTCPHAPSPTSTRVAAPWIAVPNAATRWPELIGCAHLDEERRAALWLYAWHRLEAGPRRSLASQLAVG